MNKWLMIPLATVVSMGALAQSRAIRTPVVQDQSPAQAVAPFLPNAVITQGFDALGATVNECPAGWFCQNNSAPVGAASWFALTTFQTPPFTAQAGSNAIAANFEAVNDVGDISLWLVTPVVNFNPGARLEFWLRSTDATPPLQFPDRVQVRLSTAGAAAPNVGTGATGTGDFGTLLVDVNPTLGTAVATCDPATGITNPAGGTITGFPSGAWCRIAITNAGGIPTTGSGRIAFRYFVTDGGFSGANSNAFALDTFSFDEGTAGAPTAAVGAAVVDFNRQVTSSIASRTATISNTGTAPLNVTAITAPAAPFSIGAGGTCTAVPFTLAPAASCTIVYNFSSAVEGQFQQLITVTSNGGNPTFTLRGQALASIQLPATSTIGGIALLTLVVGLGIFGLRRRG